MPVMRKTGRHASLPGMTTTPPVPLTTVGQLYRVATARARGFCKISADDPTAVRRQLLRPALLALQWPVQAVNVGVMAPHIVMRRSASMALLPPQRRISVSMVAAGFAPLLLITALGATLALQVPGSTGLVLGLLVLLCIVAGVVVWIRQHSTIDLPEASAVGLASRRDELVQELDSPAGYVLDSLVAPRPATGDGVGLVQEAMTTWAPGTVVILWPATMRLIRYYSDLGFVLDDSSWRMRYVAP